MAFLRAEKKKSGTYLRIIQSYKIDGKSKHKTVHSLGKVEDYSADQLERIAKKLVELAGLSINTIFGGSFHELGRYNYGYALVTQSLWNSYNFDKLIKIINNRSKTKFDWQEVLRLMIAERINDPSSKLQTHFNQTEYIGFREEAIPLHHFYRTLDILSKEEELIKKHIFTQQHNLFSTVLDVVFYDVTTLYFESQVEKDNALRQKGYSKDGKAHKTQVVLGLLVDKLRNPISYQIYQGNTYEGGTMIEALKKMKIQFNIDSVIVVADSAMIDKDNRNFMVENKIDYIIGDSIKSLGKKITTDLINKENHKDVFPSSKKDKTITEETSKEIFTYTELVYKGRRIICTYSSRRARKDAHERQKLIDKANKWLSEPSKYNQVKKRGAGRFITTTDDGKPIQLDENKIEDDAKFDGFKAVATTTDLEVKEILSKYRDLFEVEHTFRALKSQLQIRPVFHWTDKRIRGHIAMCFIAFTFINRLKNLTQLQYKAIVKAIDKMQVSEIRDDKADSNLFLRSKVDKNQQILIDKLGLKVPNDTTPQNAINQYFTK
ncbi:MAG: IS1634 family transposase [Patescibacteria group bacterium]|nr:IS1634 family transposase [Patescibacteria group bacterium]